MTPTTSTSATPSAPAPFSFGNPTTNTIAATSTTAPAPFSFGNPTATVTATATSANTNTNTNDISDDDDEPYLEEKAEVILKNENDNDTVLYEVECKLLRYNTDEKEWKDVGKGNLKCTRDKNDTNAKQRILVRNTMGKITLNTNMFKGMTFEKAGKNGIRFSVINPDLKKLETVMLKVKIDHVDATLDKLRDGVKEL